MPSKDGERSATVYFEFTPVVVSTTEPVPIEFTVQTDGSADSAILLLEAGGSLVLTPQVGGKFSVTVPHADALFGYDAADINRNLIGFLELYSGATRLQRVNILIGVHDDQIADVTVDQIASDMQASDYVVNIWDSDFDPQALNISDVTNRFYQEFPDDYQRLNIVSTPSVIANRYHQVVKNEVAGIGIPPYDNSAAFGSEGTLEGFNRFPVVTFFDLAENGSVHEFGHQWAQYLNLPDLQGVTPHWPISSLASGIMGWQQAGNPQGLPFPYDLIAIGGGDYQLVEIGNYAHTTFTDMELYLMGMWPMDLVAPHVVFTNQDQIVCNGCILEGPTDEVDGQDVAAFHGPRLPAYPNAPANIRSATIVVSRTALLTDREMAFFEHFTARGEATTELAVHIGLAFGTTRPFALATRFQGTMSTNLFTHTFIFVNGFESGDTSAWSNGQ